MTYLHVIIHIISHANKLCIFIIRDYTHTNIIIVNKNKTLNYAVFVHKLPKYFKSYKLLF